MRGKRLSLIGTILLVVCLLITGCRRPDPQTKTTSPAPQPTEIPTHTFYEVEMPEGQMEINILMLRADNIPSPGVVEYTLDGETRQEEIETGYETISWAGLKDVPSLDQLNIKPAEINGERISDEKFSWVQRRIKIGPRKYLIEFWAQPWPTPTPTH